MSSKNEKTVDEISKAKRSAYLQMFIIIVAFIIMCTSSYIFVSRIERRHLINHAENTLSLAEAELIANLLEYETFLSSYSETIRSMILKGENLNSVSEYMVTITKLLYNDKERMEDFRDTHGYFHSWGGKYISGTDGPLPFETNPDYRPCYRIAMAGEGKIIVSELTRNTTTGNTIMSFSRYLTDNNGEPLGVVCLDIELDRLYRQAITINLTEDSYGILLNNKLEVIAHPEYYLRGLRLSNINSGLAEIVPELERGLNIYERRLKNYRYDDSIVFFIRVKYDWYLGIVIPVREYYNSLNNMAVFLIFIGSLLASGLCFMLYRISQSKLKSDMRTQQKSNFLATMSHEIRTPLNAILGMTDIQMQNNAHPPSTIESFIKINNSGNLLLNIINDILDLSKIEAGKLELVPVKYEVASLVNDILQLNYIRYESKPIEFILEIDENTPQALVGDELRIKQILNNLLSNAFKYTEKGKVTLSVSAECVGRGGGAVLVTLVFQVKDTGQGMTSEQVNKLFDEYTRFNMEANRTTEGAGLGMTITRNLIDLMYGKISVKSAVNEGTTVTVRLPQKTDGIGIRGIIGKNMAESLRQFRHGNAIQMKKSQVSHDYMPYGNVLIVDDVETNLFVAKGLLAPYGLNIELASSGFEAIDKIKAGNTFDIVFMDHMMPKMDGIETTRQLRDMGYTRSIVALTANAIAGQAEVFLRSGFDGFISKPIDVRQLNLTLNRLIRDKHSPEEVEAAQKEKADMENKQGFGNVQQLDAQLAQIFSKDAEKAVAVLETCIKNNLNTESDISLYIINVHAMKSALANIGVIQLSETARRLENSGREKNIKVLLSETPGFINDLRKVITQLKPKENDNETTEDTEESLALLREKLLTIKEACASYEKKAAKNTLNELRENPWSNSTKELLNSISENLLHSNFDDAANLIDGFLNKG